MTTATQTVERVLRAESPERIVEAIQEVERQKQTARDAVMPYRSLSMGLVGTPGKESIALSVPMVGNAVTPHGVRTIAHEQLDEKLQIDRRYYRRMLAEAPGLLSTNVNHWLHADNRRALVRVLDGDVRAFLGDTMRVIPNYDLAHAALQAVYEAGGEVLSAHLDDEHFRLRAIHPDAREELRADIDRRRNLVDGDTHRRGDVGGFDVGGPRRTIAPGVVIENSEVGRGKLRVLPFAFEYTCLNGIIRAVGARDLGIEMVHRGSRWAEGMLEPETIAARNQVLYREIGDMVRNTIGNTERFRAWVAEINATADVSLGDEPESAVANLVEHFGMTDAERQRILNRIIAAGDPTLFGVLDAVTNLGVDEKATPDKVMEYQEIGGRIIQAGRELVPVMARRRTEEAA